MEEHFNELTPEKHERLALLLEELGEAQQVIGKILRHGYYSYNPNDWRETTNKQLLETELGDVLLAIHLMTEATDISANNIEDAKRLKNLKVGKYLHHQPEGGN